MFIVIGYGLIITGYVTLALFLGWLIATTPLLENHTLLAVYTELVISAVILLSSVMVAFGLRDRNGLLIVFGLSLSTLLLATKSTGPAYMAAIWLGTIFALSLSYSRILFAISCTMLSILLIALMAIGFNLTLGGNPISWNPESQIVVFAGRRQQILHFDIQTIVQNQVYAIFVNSSFSIIILSLFSLILSKHSLGSAVKHEPDLVFLLVALVFGVLFFSATQMTDYGMLHAAIGSDTQNSRSILPIILLSVLSLGHFFKKSSSGLANSPVRA